MSRIFTPVAGTEDRRLLAVLADKGALVEEYRAAMYELGVHLGEAVCREITYPDPKVLVVGTVEDADFLARGVLEVFLEKFNNVGFACFWNDRVEPFGLDSFQSTPIIRRYEEPVPDHIDVLVLVKSIISGACVVKTNLMDVVDRKMPQEIAVLAPVMHIDAEKKLRKDFPGGIADKFKFFALAIDDQKLSTGEVVPGIGGEVYTRLGFDGRNGKNAITPEIVKRRRAEIRRRYEASSRSISGPM